MGPRILLSGPNASGLETQVLGSYPNETLPQAGGETIQVACAADVQRPLWNRCKFHCRVGLRRYYHLVVEDLQIRRVTVFSVKETKKTVVRCLGAVLERLPLYPDLLMRLPLTAFFLLR